MEDLENCSQPKNIIIIGLPENPEKTQPRSDDLQQMLPVRVGLDTARPLTSRRSTSHSGKTKIGSEHSRHCLFYALSRPRVCLQHS